MEIKEIEVSKINPATYNPRIDLQPDSPEYRKLKNSIYEFGYVDPLIWNKQTGNLVGGHQRFKVLVETNPEKLFVSVVDLDINKEKALNIALNKIEGGWDNEKLAILFEELENEDFDFSLTGFEEMEIQSLNSKFDLAEIGSLSEYEEPNSKILVCPHCQHEAPSKEFKESTAL
ncbi:ParB N-terminal domain-containing protein [Listeria monocytogenes]|uniref:ParB N-terminal domain-containing protein n=1 Tax=Listeria monocytogenes TaxID=1639 RepID=UPI0008735B96|nr:ParB N-terminal domain-containing protein [Listeria monocytogenes]OFH54899.1 transcriptional regulator [Listeria monocytogenes]